MGACPQSRHSCSPTGSKPSTWSAVALARSSPERQLKQFSSSNALAPTVSSHACRVNAACHSNGT
eukprot:9502184-Pyramimonas_sp.AAC.1